MDSKRATELHARFAFGPYIRKQCGAGTDRELFLSVISGQGGYANLQQIFRGFDTLYPMIRTIADCAVYDVFDTRVASAYWLGGGLLTKFKRLNTQDCLKILFANLQKFGGVTDEQIAKMMGVAPKQGFLPLHLYIVLLTAKTAPVINLDAVNDHMVRWGSVRFIDGVNSRAELFSIELGRGGKLELVRHTDAPVVVDERITPDLPRYSLAAVHHGLVTKVIHPINRSGLERNTKEVIRLFNEG